MCGTDEKIFDSNWQQILNLSATRGLYWPGFQQCINKTQIIYWTPASLYKRRTKRASSFRGLANGKRKPIDN